MRLLALSIVTLLIWSCQQKNQAYDQNPAAEGFDLEHSDAEAIALADSVMNAMGGRSNWDNTRYISWNFFGRRDLVWDKFKGRVRIDSKPDSTIYLVNVNSGEGRVQIKGQELTEPDSLAKMLKRAKSIWINDSYWLVMPFKLKDTGVTLNYLGEDTLQNESYEVIQLTFKDVGMTPQNKYKLYIDKNEKLIRYWCYFSDANKDTANFTRPWDNYKLYGSILLSADRSDEGGPKNVKVDKEMPDEVFTSF